ncbi:MAG: polysaccharide biosynthesis C-terminal domain-containing protein [Gammaproteobacteria bacterium]
MRQSAGRWVAAARADLNSTGLRGQLARGAAGTLALKLLALPLSLAMSIILARALGAHGFGLYAYVVAWASAIAIPAGMGLNEYLLREASRLEPQLTIGPLLRWSGRRLWASGLVAAAVLISAGLLTAGLPDVSLLFLLAAPLPTVANLGGTRIAALRALGYPVAAQWPSLAFAPALMLALVAAAWLWRGALGAHIALLALLAASAAGLLINTIQLRFRLPREGAGILPSPSLRAALPFMLLGALHLINSRADLLMLGSLSGPAEAGVYAVVARTAELITLPLMAVNTVIAPQVASLYRRGDVDRLQRLLSASARRMLIFALPLAGILILAGGPLLGLVFGAEFTRGAFALSVLAAAQLINVGAGSVGMILNMTGYERQSAWGVAVAAALNVVLNFLLIPQFGIEGAAVATGISVMLWNLLLLYWVRRRLGLRASALGV